MHVVSGPELSLLFSPCFFCHVVTCSHGVSQGRRSGCMHTSADLGTVYSFLMSVRNLIVLTYSKKSPFSCRIPFNRHFDYTRPSVSRTFLRLPDLPTHRLYLRKCSFPLCELRNGRQTTTPRSTVPVPYKPIRAESVVHSPTKSSCATS